ncbi:MAG: hypothetical protein ISS15_06715 [Alphaproteobacteria bacterium]|nr:hypothetical protein [Alphaproteobacteria bacterium]MBL7097330.1 hypothetical protein [Alphaproteobacteria bacterium]
MALVRAIAQHAKTSPRDREAIADLLVRLNREEAAIDRDVRDLLSELLIFLSFDADPSRERGPMIEDWEDIERLITALENSSTGSIS